MESVLNYIHDKIDSYEVQIIKDEFDERKSYIVEPLANSTIIN